MILTKAERQAHADAVVARYATPDHTPRVGMYGVIWTRTHPLRCSCGRVFFGFQPEDAPFEPYRSPEPRPGQEGRRQTCGDPMCAQVEDKERFKTSKAYAWAVNQPVPEPTKITRGAA